MCLWCSSALPSSSLFAGLSGPSRSEFLGTVAAGAVALGLASTRPAAAATKADAVFRNGTIYPMTSNTILEPNQ